MLCLYGPTSFMLVSPCALIQFSGVQVVQFACPVRGSHTQMLQVTNPTYQQCRIEPVLKGGQWRIAPFLDFEPLQSKAVELSYQPMTMTVDRQENSVEELHVVVCLSVCLSVSRSVGRSVVCLPHVRLIRLSSFRDLSSSPSPMDPAQSLTYKEPLSPPRWRTPSRVNSQQRLSRRWCSVCTTGCRRNNSNPHTRARSTHTHKFSGKREDNGQTLLCFLGSFLFPRLNEY